ncbi:MULTISPECIES: glycosyltransferase [unclassified Paenibacillus]|uniref:glycosyltransferase family 2 protein n=1 Tax=unclassified Paenibacillus TaxID=185978 RepID=UPI001C12897B|nr:MULTISPECIES: glycosyltransferase [unclassified Paenibacillus]MBU5440820.1 glycosyltransferase [Paenibacillus sp. MSJ-34]CAH0118484.1 hypothetical protein PAE9249_00973 [Paenibacillus sp. CECT 9249]
MDHLRNNPKVSIIIPVYNNTPYLKQAINSALNQTYRNIELIIVDDCSTDPEVAGIVAGYSGHPLVRVYRNERNLGISNTQNEALFRSSGDIIAFLDCDDMLEPHAVELSLLHWTDETKYSFSDRMHIDEYSRDTERVGSERFPKRDIFTEHLDGNMYATHFKMISRDVFYKIGIFNPKYDSAQDYDLALRAAFHYPRSAFVHVPYAIYKYRIHSGQTTHIILQHQLHQAALISGEAVLRKKIREGLFHTFVTFVVIVHEANVHTLECVHSIENTVRIPHEIILFDNGSSAANGQWIRDCMQSFANVTTVRSTDKLSSAEAKKAALQHARKDAYYIFIDPHNVATEGWIEELLVRAEESGDIGSVACRVIYSDFTVQHAGGYERIEGQRISFKLHHAGQSFLELPTFQRHETDWNPGGATLYKQIMIPDHYYYFYDDIAVSYELRKQGKILVNAPNSLLVRRKERSAEASPPLPDDPHPGLLLRSAAQFFMERRIIPDDAAVYRINHIDSRAITDQELAAALCMSYLACD